MKPIPLYSKIQQYITDKIVTGEWPEDHQIPSEREFGEQFSVSRITAKNAVMGLVNDGMLYRYRGKGTFVAKQLAAPRESAVPPRPQKIVGFIFHWMETHYGSLLFAGLESALNELGYHVIYKRVAAHENESQAIRDLMDIPVSGLIVLENSEDHFNEDIIRLILNKYPLVLIEKTMRDMKVNSVYCDTEEAGALMAEYLLGRGLGEVGLLTYPATFAQSVKERIFGFQAGLVKQGFKPLPERHILSISPRDLIHSGEVRIKDEVMDRIYRFVQDNPQFKGIATVDALLAKYVGIACARLDRRDMVIVCCDEPSGYGGEIQPQAYIDQSPNEMGKLAAHLLVDSLEQAAAPRTVTLTPKLVVIDPDRL